MGVRASLSFFLDLWKAVVVVNGDVYDDELTPLLKLLNSIGEMDLNIKRAVNRIIGNPDEASEYAHAIDGWQYEKERLKKRFYRMHMDLTDTRCGYFQEYHPGLLDALKEMVDHDSYGHGLEDA